MFSIILRKICSAYLGNTNIKILGQFCSNKNDEGQSILQIARTNMLEWHFWPSFYSHLFIDTSPQVNFCFRRLRCLASCFLSSFQKLKILWAQQKIKQITQPSCWVSQLATGLQLLYSVVDCGTEQPIMFRSVSVYILFRCVSTNRKCSKSKYSQLENTATSQQTQSKKSSQKYRSRWRITIICLYFFLELWMDCSWR